MWHQLRAAKSRVVRTVIQRGALPALSLVALSGCAKGKGDSVEQEVSFSQFVVDLVKQNVMQGEAGPEKLSFVEKKEPVLKEAVREVFEKPLTVRSSKRQPAAAGAVSGLTPLQNSRTEENSRFEKDASAWLGPLLEEGLLLVKNGRMVRLSNVAADVLGMTKEELLPLLERFGPVWQNMEERTVQQLFQLVGEVVRIAHKAEANGDKNNDKVIAALFDLLRDVLDAQEQTETIALAGRALPMLREIVESEGARTVLRDLILSFRTEDLPALKQVISRLVELEPVLASLSKQLLRDILAVALRDVGGNEDVKPKEIKQGMEMFATLSESSEYREAVAALKDLVSGWRDEVPDQGQRDRVVTRLLQVAETVRPAKSSSLQGAQQPSVDRQVENARAVLAKIPKYKATIALALPVLSRLSDDDSKLLAKVIVGAVQSSGGSGLGTLTPAAIHQLAEHAVALLDNSAILRALPGLLTALHRCEGKDLKQQYDVFAGPLKDIEHILLSEDVNASDARRHVMGIVVAASPGKADSIARIWGTPQARKELRDFLAAAETVKTVWDREEESESRAATARTDLERRGKEIMSKCSNEVGELLQTAAGLRLNESDRELMVKRALQLAKVLQQSASQSNTEHPQPSSRQSDSVVTNACLLLKQASALWEEIQLLAESRLVSRLTDDDFKILLGAAKAAQQMRSSGDDAAIDNIQSTQASKLLQNTEKVKRLLRSFVGLTQATDNWRPLLRILPHLHIWESLPWDQRWSLVRAGVWPVKDDVFNNPRVRQHMHGMLKAVNPEWAEWFKQALMREQSRAGLQRMLAAFEGVLRQLGDQSDDTDFEHVLQQSEDQGDDTNQATKLWRVAQTTYTECKESIEALSHLTEPVAPHPNQNENAQRNQDEAAIVERSEQLARKGLRLLMTIGGKKDPQSAIEHLLLQKTPDETAQDVCAFVGALAKFQDEARVLTAVGANRAPVNQEDHQESNNVADEKEFDGVDQGQDKFDGLLHFVAWVNQLGDQQPGNAFLTLDRMAKLLEQVVALREAAPEGYRPLTAIPSVWRSERYTDERKLHTTLLLSKPMWDLLLEENDTDSPARRSGGSSRDPSSARQALYGLFQEAFPEIIQQFDKLILVSERSSLRKVLRESEVGPLILNQTLLDALAASFANTSAVPADTQEEVADADGSDQRNQENILSGIWSTVKQASNKMFRQVKEKVKEKKISALSWAVVTSQNSNSTPTWIKKRARGEIVVKVINGINDSDLDHKNKDTFNGIVRKFLNNDESWSLVGRVADACGGYQDLVSKMADFSRVTNSIKKKWYTAQQQQLLIVDNTDPWFVLVGDGLAWKEQNDALVAGVRQAGGAPVRLPQVPRVERVEPPEVNAALLDALLKGWAVAGNSPDLAKWIPTLMGQMGQTGHYAATMQSTSLADLPALGYNSQWWLNLLYPNRDTTFAALRELSEDLNDDASLTATAVRFQEKVLTELDWSVIEELMGDSDDEWKPRRVLLAGLARLFRGTNDKASPMAAFMSFYLELKRIEKRAAASAAASEQKDVPGQHIHSSRSSRSLVFTARDLVGTLGKLEDFSRDRLPQIWEIVQQLFSTKVPMPSNHDVLPLGFEHEQRPLLALPAG
ncbi:MAG: hypothetical protein AAF471_00890 [Myxococcota bacterium]